MLFLGIMEYKIRHGGNLLNAAVSVHGVRVVASLG